MDEDQILSSIIADPNLIDPGIDVSKLRQTTETNPRLLAEVPEFSGLKFDPSKGSYIEDLYSIYGGGLPTIDVAQDPTTMIPQTPVIDTPIGAGGGGGGNGGDDIITPDTGLTDFEQNLVDQGAGVLTGAPEDPVVVAPGEMPVTQAEMDEFNQIPVMQPDQGVLVGDAYAPIDTVDYSELDDFEADIGAQAIKDFEPEQQNLIDLAFSKVGSTANDVMNDLSEIPGAVVDFVNQTVDIAGKKINVGATLLKAGINKIVGGPITLVFDALSAAGLEGGPTLQTQKAQSIGLAGEGEYQDKYGINTQSLMGDYDQYNIDRVEQLEGIVADQKSRGLTNTIQMQELEDRKEYNRISGVGGDVEGDQEGITIAEDIALQDRIDAGIDAADEEPGTGIESIIEDSETGDASLAERIAAEDRATAEAERQEQASKDLGQSLHGGDGAAQDTELDYSNVTTASSPPSRGGGSGGPPSQGGGSPGSGSGCVIATHAVNSGAFTKDAKREAVRWCVKNLHRTWWGEAIRRGYRYYGQKAIDEGKAKNHYQEFKDYVAFGTGKRRTLKTGWTFVYRTVQFFLRGLTI